MDGQPTQKRLCEQKLLHIACGEDLDAMGMDWGGYCERKSSTHWPWLTTERLSVWVKAALWPLTLTRCTCTWLQRTGG